MKCPFPGSPKRPLYDGNINDGFTRHFKYPRILNSSDDDMTIRPWGF